jgi:hypothetical protein
MQILEARARAYVYAGDWVADCPRGCGNAEHLYVRVRPADPASPRAVQLPEFRCSYCGATAGIEWPERMADITAVLALRPVPHTRNWYPKDHDTAARARIPHGQSVDELRAENHEHGVPTEVA